MATHTKPRMERESLSGINVLVAGGGLGGLCAAIELYRQGHNVQVLEAKPGVEGVGQSIYHVRRGGDLLGIGPSVTRQYKKWPGMMEIHEKISFNSVMYFHKCDGELLSGPFSLKRGEAVDTMPIPVSRPKLILALYDYVSSLGIPIAFGKKVIDYYEDPERKVAGVVVEGGDQMEADLVIAADGVGSKVMRIITGNDTRAKSSGFSVFRVSYPTKRALENPFVAKSFHIPEGGDDINRFYLGNNLHGIILMTPETTIWFLTHEDKKGTAAESWSKHLDASDVLIGLEGLDPDTVWDKAFLGVMEQSPPQSIVDYKIMWRNPNPKWVSSGGRILALGDSAHSFLPTSANGATQAMEDGISIAACLKLAGKEDVPLATRAHNALRFERVSCAQLMGFQNREMLHKTDFEAAKRHPQTLAQQVGRWVSLHDPEAYVYKRWEECVRHIIDGIPFQNTNTPPGYEYKPWTIDELLNASAKGRKMENEGDWS